MSIIKFGVSAGTTHASFQAEVERKVSNFLARGPDYRPGTNGESPSQ
ncbi:MAG: hypothetical protein KJZ73_12030 [Pseudorhodoplanes sp.]|nr:hypothetical protein [Pseudorhodoplanes sp.]